MPNWTDKSDAERVARGAALLDQKRPGWEREIDIDQLSFTGADSIQLCILGQLYGDTAQGILALGLSISELQEDNWYDHGFNGNTHKLRKLWIAEVEKRVGVVV